MSGDIAPQVERSSTEVIDLSSSSESEDLPEAGPSSGGRRRSGRAARPKASYVDTQDDAEDDWQAGSRNASIPTPASARAQNSKGKRKQVDNEGHPAPAKRERSGAKRLAVENGQYRHRRPWPPAEADRRLPARFQKDTERLNWFRQKGAICWNCGKVWDEEVKYPYQPFDTHQWSEWYQRWNFEGSDELMCNKCKNVCEYSVSAFHLTRIRPPI